MKIFRKQNHGFSMVEMLISTVAILLLSLVSYRVLKSQTDRQIESVLSQKNSSVSQVALARFEKDFKRINYDWAKSGIAAIYPHQGYSFGGNYYVDTNIRSNEVLNDGVTFLTRHSGSDRLYSVTSLATRFCYPTALIPGEDAALYDTNIQLDSSVGIDVGDWVMVNQAGQYALGVVSEKTSPGEAVEVDDISPVPVEEEATSTLIKIRVPNSFERQATARNSAGTNAGFVVSAGVVPASFDFDGSATADSSDNAFCFERSKMNIQKIGSPVSYYVDYQTSDGLRKSQTNSYKLNEKGEKQRMLVRSEYKEGREAREYITPVEEVGFTYDLLSENSSLSFSSTGDVSVVRDVGRSMGMSELLDISANPTNAISNFQTSYRIIAVKMKVGYLAKDQSQSGQFTTQFQELKIALDPQLRQDMYQDQIRVASSLTQNLESIASDSATNDQIGKPLYVMTAQGNEVMVPVSSFEILADQSMGINSSGAVYVYDENGCAVNGTNCTPDQNKSAIRFSLGTGKFFPNSVVQKINSDGSRKIIVGGAAIWSTSGGGIKRIPGFGVVHLGADESLAGKLNAPVTGGTCNVSNCTWQTFDNEGVGMQELQDTAIMSVDQDRDLLYVASLTKKAGETSVGAIYKGTWNSSQSTYTMQKFVDVPVTSEGKLISAISDKPIKIRGLGEYIAVCITKQMSSSCGERDCLRNPSQTSVDQSPSLSLTLSEDNQTISDNDQGSSTDPYGEIQLISISSGIAKKIIKHNYKCSSINVDSEGNLIVEGRLTPQVFSNAKLKRALSDEDYSEELLAETMYLDEVASVNNGVSRYADYYQVDPSTYEGENGPLWRGWGTGSSTVEFSDGTFGIVYGNKYRVENGYLGNTSGSVKEYSNAGISRIKLAGMTDRVVASIETDPENINNSVITTSYRSQQTVVPDLLIPGKFFVDPNSNRNSPTPLPGLPPSLSEQSWMQVYLSFFSPRNATGLNSNMPTLNSTYTSASSCQSTLPPTCN